MFEDKIKGVMASVFGVPADTIGDDASVGSIDAWDSLHHMNLIIALEEEFGVRFIDEEIYELISIQLLTIALKGALGKQS